jgi:NAD(P)-dependent dehydrogenase (short-subunit alcohol dehydrogenase family)
MAEAHRAAVRFTLIAFLSLGQRVAGVFDKSKSSGQPQKGRTSMCAASKDGILSLTRAMALELAPYRIRVNAIAPGLTDTVPARYGSSEAEIVEIARSIPLDRIAQPEEIAEPRCFRRTRGSSPARLCM